MVNGEQIPIHGDLFYRGYNVKDLVNGFTNDNRFGFEEVTYLLLFDKLPNKEELDSFRRLLGEYRTYLVNNSCSIIPAFRDISAR